MALHLYIEKEKIIFASKDDKTSFGKAETALLSAKHMLCNAARPSICTTNTNKIIIKQREYGFQRI